MKAYPKYKDSGIDWLGEVPEHWDITNLKYVSDIIMGQSPSSNDYSEDDTDTPFLQGNAEFTESHPTPKVYCNTAVKIAPRGSLLFSVRAPVGALNRADQLYGIGRGLCAIKVNNTLINNYLWYLLHVTKTHAESLAVGSTYEAIPVHNVANMQILIPAIDEQQDIASYLSNATSRIDALIEKKEQMIELLKEKRIALITHAVTKGLDPNVKMKDSGIEWLGEVPEHWKINKFKYYYSSAMGNTILIEDLSDDSSVPVYSATEFVEILGYIENPRVVLQKNDFIIPARGNSIGHVKIVKEECTSTQTTIYAKAIKKKSINPVYVFWYQIGLRKHLYEFDNTAIPQLTVGQVKENPILVPSLTEQQAIASYLDDATSHIDTLIQKQEQMIELLSEYRSSLIHHAVTGKIDLRGYHAKIQ